MAVNILGEGRETLQRIYDEVKDLENSRSREAELSVFEDETEKLLQDKEKAVAKEIAEVTKKRREEIAATFDSEESKLNSLVKKVSGKREKYRSSKVSERISEETASFIADNKMIKEEAKKLFKQTKTPLFFNSELYYALFMPSSLRDVLVCLLAFVLFFAAVPTAVWYFLLERTQIFLIVLVYLLSVLIFGGIYLRIYAASKTKYKDAIASGNNFRNKIRNNKRVAARISRNIKKDNDDTKYGLEGYNAQLNDLKLQLDELIAKRRESLRVFDENTKLTIAEEIKNVNQAELDGYRQKLESITAELSGIRGYVKQRTIWVAENYEAFLGKENVNVDTLSGMLEISGENAAATIAEILELYKQPKTEIREAVK